MHYHWLLHLQIVFCWSILRVGRANPAPLPLTQTYGEAVASALKTKGKDTKEWLAKCGTLNNRYEKTCPLA